MLSKEMERLLNDQMNMEFSAAYIYLAMSNYAKSIDLDGSCSWLFSQYQEELVHAAKINDYLHDQGVQPLYTDVPAPKNKFENILDVLESALEHEKLVTTSIHNIMKQAKEEQDFNTETFISWYITEQIEEESSFNNLISKLNLYGDQNILLFDKELAARTFTE